MVVNAGVYAIRNELFSPLCLCVFSAGFGVKVFMTTKPAESACGFLSQGEIRTFPPFLPIPRVNKFFVVRK